MDQYPFIFLRDDESLKLLDLRCNKMISVFTNKKVDCYSYLNHMHLEINSVT